MKVLELFGGIGACTAALKRLQIPHKVVDYVEIDKYAVASYNAINGTDFEPQDICEWDKDIKVDLIMHGSPCQDFSVAGNNAGGDEGSGTRSSLMYETIRIVTKLRPKYVIWENVKNLLSKKHKHNFDSYIEQLSQLGYTSFYKVLNAKDYMIPQNRERVFTISILNGGEFEFPEKQPLKLRLKDLLESEVEEKYYLSQRMIDFYYKNEQIQKEKGNGFRFGVSDGNVVAKTVTTRAGGRMDDNFIRCQQVGTLDMKGLECIKRVYSSDGLSPTLTNMQGGHRQPKLLAAAMRGRENNGEIKQRIELSDREYANAITTVQKDSLIANDYRIRKLTPKECWRLMGFSDEDFEKAANVNSNSQLYKQAGNSIVVDVLVAIFENLFKGDARC